jgi:hypothetical protein
MVRIASSVNKWTIKSKNMERKKKPKTLHSGWSSNGDINILGSTVFSLIFEPHPPYLEKCKYQVYLSYSDVFQIRLRGRDLTLRVRIPLRQGVLDEILYDKVCQWLTAGTLVSSTNKTDHHDIAEILLNVALSTTTITLNYTSNEFSSRPLFRLSQTTPRIDKRHTWSFPQRVIRLQSSGFSMLEQW